MPDERIEFDEFIPGLEYADVLFDDGGR